MKKKCRWYMGGHTFEQIGTDWMTDTVTLDDGRQAVRRWVREYAACHDCGETRYRDMPKRFTGEIRPAELGEER